jgi:Flp pilus assembly protein TadG
LGNARDAELSKVGESISMKPKARSSVVPRRGAVAAVVAVMMVVLICFAALTIDVGHLYLTKAELQRTADSAALAGALVLADNLKLVLAEDDYGDGGPSMEVSTLEGMSKTQAIQVGYLNTTNGVAPVVEQSDVVVGTFDFAQPTNPLTVGGVPNAVQVTARFDQSSPNGPVAHFFAPLLGASYSNLSATAIAAFDDHFSGYDPGSGGPLIPFTIYRDEFEDQLVNGPDNFQYDADLDVVQSFSDGVREIRLYPYANTGGGDGAGNFGILNVGTLNQGAAALSAQLLNGVTSDDLIAEIGTLALTFKDGAGNPTTYTITGNPGVTGSLEASVQLRVGDLIGFFLHTQLVDTGSNAIYTIVDLRFGRLMEVVLNGNPVDRRIVVQPETYTGPGVITDPDAPSTGGLLGRVLMVQ